MPPLVENFSVRLSEKQLEKEKARSRAMRENLRRRKTYQLELKALSEKEVILDQDSFHSILIEKQGA